MSLKFTDAAAKKVKNLILNENNPNLKLRIYISGGGCSGFQYCFTLDNKINTSDTIIKNNGVFLIVDHMSLQYLLNASIDYNESLEGSRFFVINPNASITCGCGLSFSI